MSDERPTVEGLEWRTVRDWIALLFSGVTFRVCVKVALLVGTLLSVVNQGQIIVDGDTTSATWIRVVINYLIPFLVASVGYLAPFRVTSPGRVEDAAHGDRPSGSG